MQNFIYPVSSNKNCFPNIEKKNSLCRKKGLIFDRKHNSVVLFWNNIKMSVASGTTTLVFLKMQVKVPCMAKAKGEDTGRGLGIRLPTRYSPFVPMV